MVLGREGVNISGGIIVSKLGSHLLLGEAISEW